MVSVNNFYWSLYENLLRPTGLDCWYYYPWGTRDNLSRTGEFQSPSTARLVEPHALFHDQEPLDLASLGGYDFWGFWTNKSCRLLANSEHGVIKDQILKERGMLDWYYFYHGFAALDWFRDAEYVQGHHEPCQVYSSFNRLVNHGRSYRMAITARLASEDLLGHGDISFHTDADQCRREIEDPNTPLSDTSRAIIGTHLLRRQDLPFTLDSRQLDGDFSAHFGHREHALWQRSLWHLVNETVFYEPRLHLTEKTFKPIVAQRPFILAAAPGNLQYLRHYGFETFDRWIDESYDQEQDPDRRMDLIVAQIRRLCELTSEQRRDMLADMSPVLEHNKRHFFGGFRSRIVSELVDNFDVCIRTWNNGRVDDRSVRSHPDLESVKQILLR